MYIPFRQQIYKARCIAEGLTANIDWMNKQGMAPELIARLNRLCDQAESLQQEQNALKVRQKKTVAERNKILAELADLYRHAILLVRLTQPVESWPDFGLKPHKSAGHRKRTPQSILDLIRKMEA